MLAGMSGLSGILPRAWIPSDIANLIFDGNPSNISGNDGDLISSWPNTLGSAAAPSASGSLRPSLKTNIVNGYPVVRFGGAQGMAMSSAAYTAYSAMTVYCVFKAASTGDQALLELSPNSSSNNGGFLCYRETGNTVVASTRNVAGFANFLTTGLANNVWRIACFAFDYSLSASEATVYLDTPYDGYGTRPINANNTGMFGTYAAFIGARNQASLFLNGDIAHLLWYGGAHTLAQRQQVMAWLNDRYKVSFPISGNLLADNALTLGDANTPVRHGYSARAVFTTNATLIEVDTYNDVYGSFPASTEITVRVVGGSDTTLTASAAGAQRLSTSLAAGSKTVEVIAGLQSRPSSTVIGTFLRHVSFPGGASAWADTPRTPCLVVYGDSISAGANATNTPIEGWETKLRANYSGSVVPVVYGYRSLYDDANTSGLRADLVATIARLNPAIVWLAIGTNDYGLNKWNAASFGTAYAALLDDLHTALPSATIYCQTPLTRFSPASEAANGSGSTLANYRTQISTAQAARSSYCVLVDGPAIITNSAEMDADGVHPLTTGHATYYAYAKTVLGL